MPKEEDSTDNKHYGKFEVIMDEKDEDRSSGYDSQTRIPHLFVEPPTPTLPPEALNPEFYQDVTPFTYHSQDAPSEEQIQVHRQMALPKHMRPKSVQSFHSLNGSHLSLNSILSRSSTNNLGSLSILEESSDRCTIRRSRVLELQRELSPSVFSLVKKRLDISLPKQISASKYGGSIGCISVPGDAAPLSYSEAVAEAEEREQEEILGNVSTV